MHIAFVCIVQSNGFLVVKRWRWKTQTLCSGISYFEDLERWFWISSAPWTAWWSCVKLSEVREQLLKRYFFQGRSNERWIIRGIFRHYMSSSRICLRDEQNVVKSNSREVSKMHWIQIPRDVRKCRDQFCLEMNKVEHCYCVDVTRVLINPKTKLGKGSMRFEWPETLSSLILNF